MSTYKRKIIEIDKEKCDGCGKCAEACHEGAIRMIDGKACLVKDSYCDGLGDCIGPCPQGAITMVEREAEAYDEEAVKAHLTATSGPAQSCPGSAVRDLKPESSGGSRTASAEHGSSLSHWPVQITLVPPAAPFLQGADLLICADCVPFAYSSLHEDFLAGRAVLVGCPKLDDAGYYLDKLIDLFRQAVPSSITVLYMEVPCCGGLHRLVEKALTDSGSTALLRKVHISIRGDILSDETG